MSPPLGKQRRKTKDCATCSARFIPRSNRQRYCKKCGRRGGRVACSVCSKRFQRDANTTGLFCSRRCWKKQTAIKRTVPCEGCGQDFTKPPGLQKRRFCSMRCAYASRRKVCGPCAECGAITSRPSLKYCTRACASRANAKRNSLANFPIGTRAAHGGYMRVKTAEGWRLEHRLVMEQTLGRSLARHEHVHHKNGRRDDNSPANLELWKDATKQPRGVRSSDYHCPGCRCADL